jgi:hypothetical protein
MKTDTTEAQAQGMTDEPTNELTNVEEEAARAEAFLAARRQRRDLSYDDAQQMVLRKLDEVYSTIASTLAGLDQGFATMEDVIMNLRCMLGDHDYTYNVPPRKTSLTSADAWSYWRDLSLDWNTMRLNEQRLDSLARANAELE